MAASLGLFVHQWGVPSLWFLTDLIIIFGLVTLFFFDLRWQLLPDAFTYGLAGVIVARLIGLRPDLLVSHLAMGAFLAALFLLILLFWEKVLHRDGVGYGDVKLAFVIGALFGFPDAIGVTLVAIWAGALVGVVLLMRGRANLQTALPFGCFWTAAAVAGLIWAGPAAWLSGLVLPPI
jgi:leader peptidase (prepilin peptidase)/N-methyltransferase